VSDFDSTDMAEAMGFNDWRRAETKEPEMILEWKLVCGEWVLRGFRMAKTSTGWTAAGQYTLSPHGPPFKYRQWHRQWKGWQRFTLDHCSTIEEAKACLALMVRLS
jgi:hypothetical protein